VAAICVFCASREGIPRHYLELAADVGAEIARRGHSLVSGGGSVSMMGAVARAARAGGAHTFGVIPQALVDMEVADHDADELVVVPTMRERKALMDERADAFITLPGGVGTLEELFEIWTARSIGLHDKPVVICDPDDVFEPLRRQMDLLVGRGFARPEIGDSVAWASTAAEAVDLAEGSGTATRPDAADILEAEL
jgi:hypothetical protein